MTYVGLRTGEGGTLMFHKKVLLGLIMGCMFLGSAGWTMAALWDDSCCVAIDDLQVLQQKVALKKHEIDTARMVETIPSNFLSGQMRTSLRPSTGMFQAVSELKILFQTGEFAVQKFTQTCLERHRVAQ